MKICYTLSSLSHFSRSCFRPCWRTGLQSSRDSNLLSWPWSNKMPKYCSSGEVWPGWVGTLWKRRMVSGVRRIPWDKTGDRSLMHNKMAKQSIINKQKIKHKTCVSHFCVPLLSNDSMVTECLPLVHWQQLLQLRSSFQQQTGCWTCVQRALRPQRGCCGRLSEEPDLDSVARLWCMGWCFPLPHKPRGPALHRKWSGLDHCQMQTFLCKKATLVFYIWFSIGIKSLCGEAQRF